MPEAKTTRVFVPGTITESPLGQNLGRTNFQAFLGWFHAQTRAQDSLPDLKNFWPHHPWIGRLPLEQGADR